MATRTYEAVVMNRCWGLLSEIPFMHDNKTSDVRTDIYLRQNDFVRRHSRTLVRKRLYTIIGLYRTHGLHQYLELSSAQSRHTISVYAYLKAREVH